MGCSFKSVEESTMPVLTEGGGGGEEKKGRAARKPLGEKDTSRRLLSYVAMKNGLAVVLGVVKTRHELDGGGKDW